MPILRAVLHEIKKYKLMHHRFELENTLPNHSARDFTPVGNEDLVEGLLRGVDGVRGEDFLPLLLFVDLMKPCGSKMLIDVVLQRLTCVE